MVRASRRSIDVAWSGDRKPDRCTGRVGPRSAARWTSMSATYTNSIGATELKALWTDPQFDPRPACVLLRARVGDSHAALDYHPGASARHRATGCRRSDRAGARLELTDLVHPERGGPQEVSPGRHHRGGPEEAGRPRRSTDEQLKDAPSGPFHLGTQQRHRRALQEPVHDRGTDASPITWGALRCCRARSVTWRRPDTSGPHRRTRSTTEN